MSRGRPSNRELETREVKKRKGGSFKPAALLPEPFKQDGISYRWVRVGSQNNSDSQNVSKRLREGWTPVKVEDHPELEIIPERDPKFPGSAEVGGLLLCKTATENVENRRDYYRNVAQSQIESVDNQYLRENDPRMPLSRPERRSRTSFGTGDE